MRAKLWYWLTSARAGTLVSWLDGDVWRAFVHSRVAVAAGLVAATLVIAAAAAPAIAPHDPFDIKSLNLLESHLPPAWNEGGDRHYLLGTDEQGRDMLSAILYGSRISLSVGLCSVMLAAVLGIGLGL